MERKIIRWQYRFVLILCLQGIGLSLFAQKANVRDSLVPGGLIMPQFGAYLPLGDLKERTPVAFQVGASFLYKLKKNWVFGVSGNFLFSETAVQPRLLDNIAPIISGDGTLANIAIGVRGFSFFSQFGKIVPVGTKPNRNSGLLFMGGLGFMQHKLRIDVTGLSPQVQGEYVKGYDRLSNGFALNQFIGYIYLGNNRALNFFAGVDIIQAFTVNRRGFNYDTGKADTENRFDVLLGARVGWIITIYGRSGKKSEVKEYKIF